MLLHLRPCSFTVYCISIVFSNYDQVLILGDFDIHVCCPTHPMAQEFLDLIESFKLTQSVNAPTHSKGHIQDLVLSSGFCPLNVAITDISISDHKAVTFMSPLPSSPLPKLIPITKSCIFNAGSASNFRNCFTYSVTLSHNPDDL